VRTEDLPEGEVTFARYMHLSEIENYILSLEKKHPERVEVEVIGRSYEERPIYAVKLSSPVDPNPEMMDQVIFSLTDIIKLGRDSLAYSHATSPSKTESSSSQSDSSSSSESSESDSSSSESSSSSDSDSYESGSFRASRMYNFKSNFDDSGSSTASSDNMNVTTKYSEILSKLVYLLDHDYINNPVIDVKLPSRVHFYNEIVEYAINNDFAFLNNSHFISNVIILLGAVLPEKFNKDDKFIKTTFTYLLSKSKEHSKETNISASLKDLLDGIPGTEGTFFEINNDIMSVDLELLARIIMAIDLDSGLFTEGWGASYSPAKPIILLNGGIHAREWISPATVLYIMEQLLSEQYSHILNEVEFRIIPTMNPDGYKYSFDYDRLWRKNRRLVGNYANCSGSEFKQKVYGVDLNRNFDYCFGGRGTSDCPIYNNYRGTHGFSEPETLALKEYIEKIIYEGPSRLQSFLDIHSFGQLILHPLAYSGKAFVPNLDDVVLVGKEMAAAIEQVHGTKFFVGSPEHILYPAAGGSLDWTLSKGVPLSYAFELRDRSQFGFLLPQAQIKATGEETFAAILRLSELVAEREWTVGPLTLHQEHCPVSSESS